jgi:hypothetical protein
MEYHLQPFKGRSAKLDSSLSTTLQLARPSTVYLPQPKAKETTHSLVIFNPSKDIGKAATLK